MRFVEIVDTYGDYENIENNIGPGWLRLFSNMSREFKRLNLYGKLEVIQIRKKYGRLKFYYNFDGPDECVLPIAEIISQIENGSCNICDKCGEEKHTNNCN